MPEGDSVFRLAVRLRQVDGAVVQHGEIRGGRAAGLRLDGRRVVGHATYGKHLLTRFDDDSTLHTHMRMQGSWTITGTGRRLPTSAARGARVRMLLDDGRTVWGLELPVVEHLRTADEPLVLGHLGPDLLHDGFDAHGAAARLRASTAPTIREALLDQRVVAGLGNLWVNELCFLRGLHPATPVASVDGEPLLALARRMLWHSATTPDAYQTTTGRRGKGQRHWVVGRAGRPCLRCGTTVLAADHVDVAGSPPRRAWWCPRCQPLAAR